MNDYEKVLQEVIQDGVKMLERYEKRTAKEIKESRRMLYAVQTQMDEKTKKLMELLFAYALERAHERERKRIWYLWKCPRFH